MSLGAGGQEHRIILLGPCFLGPLVFSHIMSKCTEHSKIFCYVTSSTYCCQTSYSHPGQ